MEDFKKTMDTIHAPNDLLKRTMEKMHEENERLQKEGEMAPVIEVASRNDNKKKISTRFTQWRVQIVAAAAALVLIVGGATIYRNQQTSVPWTTPSDMDAMASDNDSSFELEKTMKGKMMDMYHNGAKTKDIKGVPVLLVYDEEKDIRYAYWETETGSGWCESDPGETEKDFMTMVKNGIH